MRKNSHDKILKGKPKEQHLSTIPKSCSFNSISLASIEIEEHNKKKETLIRHNTSSGVSYPKLKPPSQNPSTNSHSLPWFILTLPLVWVFNIFFHFMFFFNCLFILFCLGIQKCCVMYSGSSLLFQFPCLNYDRICHIHMIQILIFFFI